MGKYHTPEEKAADRALRAAVASAKAVASVKAVGLAKRRRGRPRGGGVAKIKAAVAAKRAPPREAEVSRRRIYSTTKSRDLIVSNRCAWHLCEATAEPGKMFCRDHVHRRLMSF